MTMDVPRHSLSPGERARVRASVKTILCSTFLFCLAFTSPLLADDVITNVMSPIVSFQYPDNFSSQALTNGGLMSPIASYQYFEWPGDDVLQLQSSLRVSYYYQFLDAPQLTIIPTFRVPTTAESTPAVLPPPPTDSQLKTFYNSVFTDGAPPLNPARMTIVLTHGWRSRPTEWAQNMAALILANVTPAPNIVAWDWEDMADTWLCNPGKAAERTPEEGRALGQALLTRLGAGYSQPVHFIGHSFGTLVNAHAANWLHGDRWAGAMFCCHGLFGRKNSTCSPQRISLIRIHGRR